MLMRKVCLEICIRMEGALIKIIQQQVEWYRKAAEQGHAYAQIKYEAEIIVETAKILVSVVLISLGLYCVATGYCLQICFLPFICYSIFCFLGGY